MKVGDLLRHKRRGWLALVLEINERNMTVEFMWLDSGQPRGHPWCHGIDYSSMRLFEVVSETG